MTTLRTVRLTVNGKPYEAEAEPRTTLVDFLRHGLGITGTHVGCEHGVCGACTVLINGKTARSCLTLAVQVDGASLSTIDGLANGDELHPIQQAFIEEHGLQCGFCTPGMIMATHELLHEHPNPTDDDIREALGGQICRCTGYQSIYRAVRLAATKMQGARAGAVCQHP